MTNGAEPRSILLVRLHGLGDTLMTTPALRAVRRRFPRAQIVMLVGASAAPALLDNPHLDRLLAVPDRLFFGPRPIGLLRLAVALRRERFDWALLFSRSRALERFVRLAGARRVLSLPPAGPADPSEGPDPVRYELAANLDLLRALDVPPQGLEMELHVPPAASARAETLLAAGRRYAVLAPGGGENAGWSMPQKRWPAERFAALARELHERLGLANVVVGGPQDALLAAEIARLPPPGTVTDATGNSLAVTAAIIGRGSLLVTNDSVAMHLGLALKTPFVALFGPTNPRAVLPPDGPFRALQPDVPCSPCFWQEKPGLRRSAGRGRFEPCPRFERSCLESISVASVAQAARELL